MPACCRRILPAARRLPLVLLIVALDPATAASRPPSELSAEHRQWLEQVAPLLTDAERAAFDQLTEPYQRDAFIARFWSERGDFHDVWTTRARLAEEQFGTLVSDRARTLLLNGPPELILSDLCPEIFVPMEAWFYPGTEDFPRGYYLVFAATDKQADPGFRHWSPDTGIGALLLEPAAEATLDRCARRREWEMVAGQAVAWGSLVADHELLPAAPEPWVESFLDRVIRPDPDAPILTAGLEVSFPGTDGDRTVVQVELALPRSALTPSSTASPRYRVQVDGEILRHGSLHDRFRYRFDSAADEPIGDLLPLEFQRPLLPGEYRFVMQLQDRNSGAVFRSDRPLQVPASATPAVAAVDSPLTEANAVLGAGDHMVKIEPLADQLLTDRVRVEAEATGPDIAKVAFELDGRPVMSKTRPPYSVEIDIGRAPRVHSLAAIAVDATGNELAHDLVPINAGPHRFSVRLIEPRRGARYIQSLRAVAEVHLPAGETLDRVDFYLNEALVATLFQPPFAQPIRLPESERISYVRAVAYLDDGNQTEDLVFVNSPGDLDSLHINMVELYTTVSDKKGLPVDDLRRDEFVISEEGRLQEIRRFERVSDRSIHAGVILDASTSMREEIDVAVEGALEFFSSVIRPQDRAAVFVFNDEPQLQVPFTNDLEDLGHGLEDVRAEGETALYDTLVYALYYFAGLRGKRALILISDGEDSKSHHTLAETMDFAQRSGVAIYPVALGLDRRSLEARGLLIRLARETGGRFFSIASARELEDIYDAIDTELRSQYLLVYQSTYEEGGDFRKIEVTVDRPGLMARTIPGYYP